MKKLFRKIIKEILAKTSNFIVSKNRIKFITIFNFNLHFNFNLFSKIKVECRRFLV